MDHLIEGQTLTGVLFALFLCLLVFFAAKRSGYFNLPPEKTYNPVTLRQTLGAFLVYLLLGMLILPLIALSVGYLLTGDVYGLKKISISWLVWIQIFSLGILFFSVLAYCSFIPAKTRDFIFWGEGDRTSQRFFKSVGIGALSWLISYPFVLLMGILTRFISGKIWGDYAIEQVAVKQLKNALGHPILFGILAFAVVILVPFLEELLFRGFLQSYLKKKMGRLSSILLTAAIFAVVHFAPSQGVGNFTLIFSLFVLALFLGFLYEREENLWAPIALHTTFNGLSVLFIFLS